MAALFCMCIKELGHGPLEVNAKSENMITCKTFILSIWYQKFPYLFSRFLKKASHVHFGLSFLLYLWTSTSCPGFPGILLSRGFCYPGDFALPGMEPSRGICCPGVFAVLGILPSQGFCLPGDFPCFPEIPHAFPKFWLPEESCGGRKTCIALALYLKFF